jgi:hypothetical protein
MNNVQKSEITVIRLYSSVAEHAVTSKMQKKTYDKYGFRMPDFYCRKKK